MRIAHFSDPHLLRLRGARVRDFLNKRWIGGMNLLANRGRHHRLAVFEAMVEEINRSQVDHVLVTGDITNVAHEDEFRLAREVFDRLALGAKNVSVIPGNHDAYVAQGMALFDAYFGPYSTPDPEWTWPGASRWPVVRVRGPVAFILLNTSHPTPWFNAWGRVGSEQLGRLGELLSDARLADKFRLVAIHHPPAGPHALRRVRGLRDHEAFSAVIREHGADLIVHGHEHQDLRLELPGPSGAVPVRCIQSASYEAGVAPRRARFRVFEVPAPGGPERPEVKGGRFLRESLYVWHPEQGGFVEEAAMPVT
jgi:3',5'-cyclic AMP phosphodiesterase CpdA